MNGTILTSATAATVLLLLFDKLRFTERTVVVVEQFFVVCVETVSAVGAGILATESVILFFLLQRDALCVSPTLDRGQKNEDGGNDIECVSDHFVAPRDESIDHCANSEQTRTGRYGHEAATLDALIHLILFVLFPHFAQRTDIGGLW